MEWITTILSMLRIAPEVKKWIDVGLPVLAELQKENPKLIPVFENIGIELFPALTDKIKIVAAAADALFDPYGTMWVQTSLNRLTNAGLKIDGSYGPLTKAAVTAFQEANQPASGPVDGWAGPRTYAVITAKLAALGA